MKITIKTARETLPSEVSQLAIKLAKDGHTNAIHFEHKDFVYFDEDAQYTAFVNGQSRTVQCGGEWNGYKTNDPIGKATKLPVGAFVIERARLMGKLFVTVFHNNGTLQVK